MLILNIYHCIMGQLRMQITEYVDAFEVLIACCFSTINGMLYLERF